VTWAVRAIVILILAQLVGLCGFFAHHVAAEGANGLRIFVAGVALFTLLTLGGLVLRKPWMLWATLVVASLVATIDLFAWERNDRIVALASLLLLVATTLLVFREPVDRTPFVSFYQRVLFGFVFGFAAWVAFWGLFQPAHVTSALPFVVPPLHARFLGAMYLSGCVYMVFGMAARDWSEVRVMTAMLAIWTGMLGLVSLFHLEAFDWSRSQVWFWFFAYICYPLVAAWIVWRQRALSPNFGRTLSAGLQAHFYVQGTIATLLGLGLLLVPHMMTTVWPWPISTLLAQIYSAPFLSYGIGSIYAARQRTWREVRIVVAGTLVFTVGVLIASAMHAKLFDWRSLSAWLWFGGFAVASLATLLFSTAEARLSGSRLQHSSK